GTGRPLPAPRPLHGGAVSHKGVHDLVAAFGAVARADPSAELTVVGPAGAYALEEVCPLDDPAAVARLRPYYGTDYGQVLRVAVPADLAGRVRFAGAVPRAELVGLVRAADVFVFPPLWDEGFGLPPVEAMAAGVPVVVTRSGALVETVVDGRTGLVVDKGRPDALAAAILRLLGDDALRAGMGAAGRRHVESRYAWPVVAGRARELYASAVAARAGTRPPAGDAG
ncbi:MAG TPA: glycosyltransferase family 4 protein, partial [Frankiaceae bacterium]|nr:glycosyltransferase family 4 protein [Frankiaceae bacterium]